MNDAARSDRLPRLEMLASALAGRDIGIDDAGPGVLAWTDGKVIHVDGSSAAQAQLMALCVQCALLAAGSLELAMMRHLQRRPALARRYLALEGRRALSLFAAVLPPLMQPVIEQLRQDAAASQRAQLHSRSQLRSDSPAASLDIAQGNAVIPDPPPFFGAIHPRKLLAAAAGAGGSVAAGRHIPRQQQHSALTELAETANQDDEDSDDFASSPVGGGGGLGKLLQRMFQMVRQVKGGGTPGADAPTHWIRSGTRTGVRAMHSTASAQTLDDAFGKGQGIRYPEWNVHRRSYRLDWCTVLEREPPLRARVSVSPPADLGLRKPLLRLGMGLDRYHRQAQGDDIDIDAAIEAQLALRAGSAVDEALYVESQRHRRELSVLILLDISGSVAQASAAGVSVYEQQRSVAAALVSALHDVGDRVALYAFHSQGRSLVHLVPVKRFDEHPGSAVMSRLFSLQPGAYSRLGAAIRHATTELLERAGTPRRLLLVLSDGLAYDHGYEPAYGAADARQALQEARRDGVGCVCLSVGASTDVAALRSVFGSAAFAAIARPSELGQLLGPLLRSALRAAEVQRRRTHTRHAAAATTHAVSSGMPGVQRP